MLNGSFYDNVGIRRRGITSLNWPKPKIKVDSKQGSVSSPNQLSGLPWTARMPRNAQQWRCSTAGLRMLAMGATCPPLQPALPPKPLASLLRTLSLQIFKIRPGMTVSELILNSGGQGQGWLLV